MQRNRRTMLKEERDRKKQSRERSLCDGRVRRGSEAEIEAKGAKVVVLNLALYQKF